MADIETLLGMRADPTTDMRALAAALRDRQRGGAALSLSTIPQVQALGEAAQSTAQRAAQRGGVLRETRAREAQRTAEADRAHHLQLARDAESRRRYDETYERKLQMQEDAHNRALELQREREAAKTERERVKAGASKLSASERKLYNSYVVGVDEGKALLQKFLKDPTLVNPGQDWGISVAKGTPLVGDLIGPWWEREVYTADQRDTRAALAKYIEDFRRQLAGANLTRMETTLIKEWSPNAPGIKPEDVVNRIQNMVDALERRANRMTPDNPLGNSLGSNWGEDDGDAPTGEIYNYTPGEWARAQMDKDNEEDAPLDIDPNQYYQDSKGRWRIKKAPAPGVAEDFTGGG